MLHVGVKMQTHKPTLSGSFIALLKFHITFRLHLKKYSMKVDSNVLITCN